MWYFAAMTAEETAGALGESLHTVRHNLRLAQAGYSALKLSRIFLSNLAFSDKKSIVRRDRSNHKSGLFLGALAFLLIAGIPAKADSVTYSFFGSAWLQGTSFTYLSPTGFLTFDTGSLAPTTASDVFFYDVNGAYFKNDIGKLANFDFVSEDELLLHTTTNCSLDFTLSGGFSHVHSVCPGDTLTAGSSIPGSGYLLNVYTNFDVVGTGGIGIRPTDTGGGGTGGSTPEPSSLILLGLGLASPMFLRRRRST